MLKPLLPLLALSVLSLPAQASFTWMLQSLSAQPLNLLAGDTFSLQLTLTSTSESILGYDDFLETFRAVGSLEPSGQGLFTLISRDVSGSQFTSLNTTNVDGLVLPDFAQSPAPVKVNLGGGRETQTNLPPGSYPLALYTFRISPNAPSGDYTIRTSPASTVSSGAAGTIPKDTAPGSSSVEVKVTAVPEPATTGLALAGMTLLLSRRCRRPSLR